MNKYIKQFFCIVFTMCMLLQPALYVQAEETDADSIEEQPKQMWQIKQVNPIYEGIITEEDLEDASDEIPASFSSRKTTSDGYTDDIKVIGDKVRQAMVKRQKNLTVHYYLENGLTSEEQFSQLVEAMLEEAFKETDNPKEGDYLRYNLWGWEGQMFFDETGKKADLVLTLTYQTTAEQEAAVDKKLQTVLWETLNLDTKNLTNYEKTKKIYDYICQNVKYDEAHLDNPNYKIQFSAYGAFIKGTSVCQGYASLLYRMLEEAGLDARVVVGFEGERHAWNIVRLGNKYYYLDSTWDAEMSKYGYFLKGYTNFEKDHTPEHGTSVFEDKYANTLSATDFVPGKSDDSAYEGNLDVPTEHKHSLVKVAAKSATCTANGRITHYKCKECGSLFKDANAETKLRTADVTVSAKGHKYGSYKRTAKATFGKTGKKVAACSRCGGTKTKTIPAANTPKLSTTSYTFNNKTKNPSLTVKNTAGTHLSYYMTYAIGKDVGKYKVTVELTDDDYTGTKTVYYKINPKGVSISTLTKAKKAFTVKWKKPSSTYRKQMTGYQIRYSTSSKMTNAKKITVKSTTATSRKISKLTAKKYYYVQVRTYKKIGSSYYYSGWSSVKKVKTK